MSRRNKRNKVLNPAQPAGLAEEVLSSTCFLKGHDRFQDAIFNLLPNNTVQVLVQNGRVGCRDEILSVRRAFTLRKELMQKGWQQVDAPRRPEDQIKRGIESARRSFVSQPLGRMRRPLDPEANMTPPEREMLRQRDRVAHSFAAAGKHSRVVPGGAIETNKRKH